MMVRHVYTAPDPSSLEPDPPKRRPLHDALSIRCPWCWADAGEQCRKLSTRTTPGQLVDLGPRKHPHPSRVKAYRRRLAKREEQDAARVAKRIQGVVRNASGPLSVWCPLCRRAPGWPCRTVDGVECEPHRERVRRAQDG